MRRHHKGNQPNSFDTNIVGISGSSLLALHWRRRYSHAFLCSNNYLNPTLSLRTHLLDVFQSESF